MQVKSDRRGTQRARHVRSSTRASAARGKRGARCEAFELHGGEDVFSGQACTEERKMLRLHLPVWGVAKEEEAQRYRKVEDKHGFGVGS